MLLLLKPVSMEIPPIWVLGSVSCVALIDIIAKIVHSTHPTLPAQALYGGHSDTAVPLPRGADWLRIQHTSRRMEHCLHGEAR